MLWNKRDVNPWDEDDKKVNWLAEIIEVIKTTPAIIFTLVIVGVLAASVAYFSTTGNHNTKNIYDDPAYTGNASIGGGVNLDDDGPGEFQAMTPPAEKEMPIPDSHILETYGTTPSLELLQKQRVSCVYDADGNAYPLFETLEDGSYAALDVELPDMDVVYADAIQSGHYIKHGDKLYVIFGSSVSQVKQRGSMWLNVYDTLATDLVTGEVLNTADQPAA